MLKNVYLGKQENDTRKKVKDKKKKLVNKEIGKHVSKSI